MPKRVDVIQTADEDRYFAIWNGYPLRGDMELVGDQKLLAYWLSAIVEDPRLIRTIYHKPRSPSIIIVGISKEFNDLRKLLGAHSWSKFLQSPAAEENNRMTKIYFCSLGTDLQLTKVGWKRVEVEDDWFFNHQWSLVNKVMKNPYPKTKHCEVPNDAASKVELELCRPLPLDLFPEIPRALPAPVLAAPIVGSAAYYQTRTTASSETPSTGLSKATRKRGNKKKTWSPNSGDALGDGNNIDSTDGDPVRPPVEDWFMALAEQMSLRPDLALGAPPGIPVPSWANEMDYQDGYRDPMVNEPRTKSDSIAAAMEAFELGDDDEYDPLYPSTCSDSLVPGDSMSNVGRAPRNYEGNDDDADTGMPVGPPVDDGWGNAPIYIYETEKPLNWRRPGQPTDCPEHGIRCPKGMCRFQAQKKANERRRQEEAERQAQRKEQREKNIKRSERKNGNTPYDRPPHLSKAEEVEPDDSISERGRSPSGDYSENEDEDEDEEIDHASAAPSRPFTDVSYGDKSVAASTHVSSGYIPQHGKVPASGSVASGWTGIDSNPVYGNRAPSAISSAAPSTSRSTAPSAPRSAAPSVAPSAARSGWSGVSEGGAFAFNNQGTGNTWGAKPKVNAWGKPPSVAPGPTLAQVPQSDWDDDARSNVTVGRSSAAQSSTLEEDAWDAGSAISLATATTNAGWGPPKGIGTNNGAGTHRGRGRGGDTRGRGRGWGQPARGRGRY